MKRIHRFVAVGASGLLLTLALTPAALAAGGARAATGVGTASVPNSNIKGKPTHFSPNKLSATAKNPPGSTTCTASKASFSMTNLKKSTQTVTLTGTDGLHGGTVSIAPSTREIICVTKGYKGTITGKLKDKKKLTVKF